MRKESRRHRFQAEDPVVSLRRRCEGEDDLRQLHWGSSVEDLLKLALPGMVNILVSWFCLLVTSLKLRF